MRSSSRASTEPTKKKRVLPAPPLKGSALEQIAYVNEHCPRLSCLKRVRAGLTNGDPVDELSKRAKQCTRTCYLSDR